MKDASCIIFIQGGIYMDKGNNEITVNRTFKSRIFAMLYRDKEGILSEFLSQNRMEAKV